MFSHYNILFYLGLYKTRVSEFFSFMLDQAHVSASSTLTKALFFSEHCLNSSIFNPFLIQSTGWSPLNGRGTNTFISPHVEMLQLVFRSSFEPNLPQVTLMAILISQFVPATT